MITASSRLAIYRRLTVGLMAVICVGARAQTTHWAFKPLTRPNVPQVAATSAVRNSIDAYVLKELSTHKLALSPPADRRTLIRRVTFDLIGLPPTPEEIAAFLTDRSPNAYEKVVRRLLASPHFGERWAQHWLDVVRFAESNGYEHDEDRQQAWRYRDWVVNGLNADKPYPQFLREQVAGDLIAPDDFNARVATGYLRCGPFHLTGGNLDPKEMRQEWLTEAVNGLGNTVLGLTVGCARCHDHKFDPIPQADYYRLQAFFASTSNKDQSRATEQEKKQYDDAVKAIKDRMKPIEAQIAAIEKPYREMVREQKKQRLAPEYKAALAVEASKRTPEQKKLASESGTQLNISWDDVVNVLSPEDKNKRAALRRQIFAIEREMPSPLPEAQGVGDGVQPAPPTNVLVRGDVHNPGMEVVPAFPGVLVGFSQDVRATDRLALADWLASPKNALVSRVMVNRVWHYLFGRGLVATPNDFGKKGLPPSHPELLERLAYDFAKDTHGSIKGLIKLMVTSEAYMQSSAFDSKKAAVDPDNRMLWRMNRKRLDAEALRDSVMATAGTLNRQLGGPSIRVPLEPEVYDTIFTESEPDNLWPPTPDEKQHNRRSLYLFRKRNVRLPMLAVFDQPDMMSSCAARGQTVHALQALTLVNGEFMRKQSFELAARLFREFPINQRLRIDRMFALTLGRPPNSVEMRATLSFIDDQVKLLRRQPSVGTHTAAVAPKNVDTVLYIATADLCLATLNLNDFVYLR